MKKDIFVALDFNSLDKALDTTKKLKDQIAGIKIGSELYAICGANGLKKFRELGLEIFLDLKLHDIPNQVKKTVAAIASLKTIKYLEAINTNQKFLFNEIYKWSEIQVCDECLEYLVSIFMEPFDEIVNEFKDKMSSDEDKYFTIPTERKIYELRNILENNYSDILKLDLSALSIKLAVTINLLQLI